MSDPTFEALLHPPGIYRRLRRLDRLAAVWVTAQRYLAACGARLGSPPGPELALAERMADRQAFNLRNPVGCAMTAQRCAQTQRYILRRALRSAAAALALRALMPLTRFGRRG